MRTALENQEGWQGFDQFDIDGVGRRTVRNLFSSQTYVNPFPGGIDSCDHRRCDEDRLPPEPVAGVDDEIGDSPPFVEEEIVNVPDAAVCGVDMKAADLAGSMQHVPIVGNFAASPANERTVGSSAREKRRVLTSRTCLRVLSKRR